MAARTQAVHLQRPLATRTCEGRSLEVVCCRTSLLHAMVLRVRRATHRLSGRLGVGAPTNLPYAVSQQRVSKTRAAERHMPAIAGTAAISQRLSLAALPSTQGEQTS